MNKEEIFKMIVQHTCEVIPELEDHTFKSGDQLKELGANSVDRAEIISLAMESLSLQIPMVEVFGAKNLDELATLLYENQ
ncbi:polyketide biosynthesis acyl carrier protein [Chitinophaga niastensis]|uniref:Polyketide biosynthesis acyl carrier protein n=1 Tax=Chitinophaga niastensis TaxID=536980 RepID=A0A2P8HPR1_CHINA|nr:acyl carrier protein [Chitinophaga niastensis]PSL48195.1 polyketide biosynthesis acyl carrier protein [Chitinophaga niastensis]